MFGLSSTGSPGQVFGRIREDLTAVFPFEFSEIEQLACRQDNFKS